MIGVNISGCDAKQLKQAMDKEHLNWRSFVGTNEISDQWNSPGTPTLYVIDHKGTIRYKWLGKPGDHALDSALEMLIKEVGGNR